MSLYSIHYETGKGIYWNMARVKWLLAILKQSFAEWNADNVPRLAAALAYYTAFSIAPLLIVVIAIVGFVFRDQAEVQNQITRQLQGAIGHDAASLIEELIVSASQPAEGVISTVIGVVTLLMGAIGVFEQLKSALNTIWNVPAAQQPSGIVALIRQKFLSFGFVLGVGFLLIVSLVASTALTAVNERVAAALPGGDVVAWLVNFALSFGVITILFAMIYKFLPDTKVAWKDVWIGAAVTSLLFYIGKTLLSFYLANAAPASAYGAAGSLVVMLLWIYYSAQIVMFGAEFTQVYAKKVGSWAALPEAAAPKAADLKQDLEKAKIEVEYAQRQAAQAMDEARRNKRRDPMGIFFGLLFFLFAAVTLPLRMIEQRNKAKGL